MDGPTREHGAPDSNRVPREPALVAVLAVATGLALYLCYLLVAPFLPALAWAVALAIPTHPVYDWLRERIGHKNLAAGLTVFAVAVVVFFFSCSCSRSLSGRQRTRFLRPKRQSHPASGSRRWSRIAG